MEWAADPQDQETRQAIAAVTESDVIRAFWAPFGEIKECFEVNNFQRAMDKLDRHMQLYSEPPHISMLQDLKTLAEKLQRRGSCHEWEGFVYFLIVSAPHISLHYLYNEISRIQFPAPEGDIHPCLMSGCQMEIQNSLPLDTFIQHVCQAHMAFYSAQILRPQKCSANGCNRSFGTLGEVDDHVNQEHPENVDAKAIIQYICAIPNASYHPSPPNPN